METLPTASDVTRTTLTSEMDRLDNLVAAAHNLAEFAGQNATRLGGAVPAAVDPPSGSPCSRTAAAAPYPLARVE